MGMDKSPNQRMPDPAHRPALKPSIDESIDQSVNQSAEKDARHRVALSVVNALAQFALCTFFVATDVLSFWVVSPWLALVLFSVAQSIHRLRKLGRSDRTAEHVVGATCP